MEWLAVGALLVVVVILSRSGQPQQSLLVLVALFAVVMASLKGSVTGLLGAYAQLRASSASATSTPSATCLLDFSEELNRGAYRESAHFICQSFRVG